MTAVEHVAGGFTFLEAPRWHEGALWLSDFYSHRVLRYSDGEFTTVCMVPGQPSGLGFAPNGDLLVVSMLDQRLLRLRDGWLETVADLSSLCDGPANDMVVDGNGRAYVGNDGQLRPLTPTVLIRCDLDGSCQVAADGVIAPNGSVISRDGRLIVAETFAGRLSAWAIAPDGSLSDRHTWASFASTGQPSTLDEAVVQVSVLPDGICTDALGQVWVADAGGSGVWCVQEGGRVVDHVETGDLTAYAVALGDPDGRTLYICAAPPLPELHRDGRAQSVLLRTRVTTPADHGRSSWPRTGR